MLNNQELRKAAQAILKTEETRMPTAQLSRLYPTMTIEDAYRVQDLCAEARIAKGARVVGHKIGPTSRAMQMASKMTEPDLSRRQSAEKCRETPALIIRAPMAPRDRTVGRWPGLV